MRMLMLLTILSVAAASATTQGQKTSSGSKSTKTNSGKHGPRDGAPVTVSDTSSRKDAKNASTWILKIYLPHPANPTGLGHQGSDDPNATVQHIQCDPPNNGPQYSLQNDWALVLSDTTLKQLVVLAAADGGHGVDVLDANASCTYSNSTKMLSCAGFQTGAIQLYDGQGNNQLLACTNVEVDIQYQ